jgi:NitT/TauT family transport system substrate-binding protein
MKLSIRRGTVAMIAAAAVAAVSGCAAGAETTTSSNTSSSTGTDTVVEEALAKINFGYITDYNGTSLLAIANELGIWEKYNIDANYFTFTNGPLQIQAMATGDLDFGYIGPGAFWLPASGEGKFITINTIGNGDRVIVRADSGITSIEELRGRDVAYPAGTSGEQILGLALESAGMTFDDITPVIMDPATLVAAFSAGKIDAAGIWYPNIDVIKESVDIIELAGNEDFSSRFAFPNAYVTSNEMATEHADVVMRVQAALKEANDYRFNFPDETIALVAKQLGLDEELVAKDASRNLALSTAELEVITTDGTVTKWLDALNGNFVDAGRFADLPDAASTFLIDSFVDAKTR